MSQAESELKNTIPRPGIVFLRLFPSQNLPKPLTISISKKVFPTAVQRNAAKRRVREGYRLALKDLKTASGASGKSPNHDTLQQLPPLRIDAREAVLKMKIEDIKNLIKAQFDRQSFK